MSKSYFTVLSLLMCGGSMLSVARYFRSFGGAARVTDIAANSEAGRRHFIDFSRSLASRRGRQAVSWREADSVSPVRVVEPAFLSYIVLLASGQPFTARWRHDDRTGMAHQH